MQDISLHILDIVENSVAAKATEIEIIISEDKQQDLLSVEIIDNGVGMDKETLEKALDPFYTSKTVRRFGFGLSLLSESAKAANGDFSIVSNKGEGTRVKAEFQYSHIDRKPLGDISSTIFTLVFGNPEIDLIIVYQRNGQTIRFDTKEIRDQLQEAPINSPAGMKIIRENLREFK